MLVGGFMMLRRGRLVGLCEDEMRFLWLDLHKFFFLDGKGEALDYI